MNAATFIMTGGTIENCKGSKGGALAVVYDANLTMSGGTIKGNRSDKGAGIYIGDHSGDKGSAVISENAVISGNTLTNGSVSNNVQPFFSSMLIIKGAYKGQMGVTLKDSTQEGAVVASCDGVVSGADKIFLDTDKTLVGSINGSNIVWAKSGKAVTGTNTKGSNTQDGKTQGGGAASCYIGTNSGKTYTNLAEAISISKGDTIHLLGNMTWNTDGKSIDNSYFLIDGHGYKITVNGAVKIYQSSHVKLKKCNGRSWQ